MIHRMNMNPIKISKGFATETTKNNPKICLKSQKDPNS